MGETDPKFSQWPLGVMREIEALRCGLTDEEFVEQLEGVRLWLDRFIAIVKAKKEAA